MRYLLHHVIGSIRCVGVTKRYIPSGPYKSCNLPKPLDQLQVPKLKATIIPAVPGLSLKHETMRFLGFCLASYFGLKLPVMALRRP